METDIISAEDMKYADKGAHPGCHKHFTSVFVNDDTYFAIVIARWDCESSVVIGKYRDH